MAQGKKSASAFVTVAIFIILEIVSISLLRRTSTLQDIWLNRISHRTMAVLWSSGETVRNHFLVDKQNQELMEENARLYDKLRRYQQVQALREEYDSLARNLSDNYRYTPATIVKISRNSAHNYIILNKGSEDGIRPQSGIITEKGVVGIVDAVDKHYSYGLTLMNSKVSVGARVGKEGVVAPLTWDGINNDGGVVSNIPRHYEIAPGDTVKTSGYSTIFPADIPIGITGETTLVDGSVNQVHVTLFQDFSNIHYVTVVENLHRSEIMALEAAEEEQE